MLPHVNLSHVSAAVSHARQTWAERATILLKDNSRSGPPVRPREDGDDHADAVSVINGNVELWESEWYRDLVVTHMCHQSNTQRSSDIRYLY